MKNINEFEAIPLADLSLTELERLRLVYYRRIIRIGDQISEYLEGHNDRTDEDIDALTHSMHKRVEYKNALRNIEQRIKFVENHKNDVPF